LGRLTMGVRGILRPRFTLLGGGVGACGNAVQTRTILVVVHKRGAAASVRHFLTLRGALGSFHDLRV
jgi:hypothetical protein